MFLRKIRAPGFLGAAGGFARGSRRCGPGFSALRPAVFLPAGSRFSCPPARGFPKSAKSFLFENKIGILENNSKFSSKKSVQIVKKSRENRFCWEIQELKRRIWKKNVAGFPKSAKSFLFENKTGVLENCRAECEEKEEK